MAEQKFHNSGEHPATLPEKAPPVSQGLATAALVLGILAFLGGAVPVLGLLTGGVAILLGVLALRRKQPRGKAKTGVVLGSLAAVASVLSTIALIAFGGNLINALQDPENWLSEESVNIVVNSDELLTDELLTDEDATGGEIAESNPAPEPVAQNTFRPVVVDVKPGIPWDAYSTNDMPLSTNAGTKEDPHRMGTRIIGDNFELVMHSFSDNATEQLLEWEPENAVLDDTQRYVVAQMTLQNLKKKPILGYKQRVQPRTTNRSHEAFNVSAITPVPPLFVQGQMLEGNFSGYIAFLIDNDQESEFMLYLDRTIPTSNGYIALD